MSNIEKIRQEVERRKKVYLTKNGFPKGTIGAIKIETYEGLLAFIDSLPEEKPSEDLEEAAEKYADGEMMSGLAERAFIAGAEWQREQMELDGIVTLTESDFNAEKEKASEWGYNLCKKQMMNGAVEVDVADLNGEIYNNCIEKGMTDEDKVKIIIIKDND